MRVLVTGATGYLGRALVPRLLAERHQVRALVRGRDRAGALAGREGVELFVGDVTIADSLAGIEEGIDRVFHLAVLGHTSGVEDEASYLEVNRAGTENLLRRFAGSAVQRIVFTTTTAALGPIGDRVVTELDSAPPVTAYGRSKRAAEQIARRVADAYALPLVMVRLTHVYGPGEDRDLYRIVRMIRRGVLPQIGLRPNLYPAVYLDDAIDGLLLAAERGRPGETYIVTDRDSHDLRDVRRVVLRELGIGRRLYPWLPARPTLAVAGLLDAFAARAGIRLPVSRKNLAFVTAGRRFSIEKARRELGYEPRVSLDEGLRRAVAWYRQEGML